MLTDEIFIIMAQTEVSESVVVVSETAIQHRILEVRGIPVMLDSDLASLYQIETKNLKRQVRRNLSRFPTDFMFELSEEESMNLRCQNVTSSAHGGNRYRPFAFTELGVAMLSSVLTSEVAVQVNIAIMRAFAAMKNYLSRQSRLGTEVESLKSKVDLLTELRESDLECLNDLSEDLRAEIGMINQAIADLSVKVEEKKNAPRTKIGFKSNSRR